MRQRHAAGPVQQVQVDILAVHALQAALASLDDAAAARVMGIKLADQEQAVAAPANGFADHFLGAAFAVHFGGVDHRYIHFDGGPDQVHFAPPQIGVLAHAPGAETENGHTSSRG